MWANFVHQQRKIPLTQAYHPTIVCRWYAADKRPVHEHNFSDLKRNGRGQYKYNKVSHFLECNSKIGKKMSSNVLTDEFPLA